MELKEIVKNYFDIFSNKDIQNLKKLFSNDITLKDWEIEANGIDEVIEANLKIFNSVETITVTPQEIYQDNFVTICIIDVLINKKETLKVIDIIKFNKNKKIEKISAYRQ